MMSPLKGRICNYFLYFLMHIKMWNTYWFILPVIHCIKNPLKKQTSSILKGIHHHLISFESFSFIVCHYSSNWCVHLPLQSLFKVTQVTTAEHTVVHLPMPMHYGNCYCSCTDCIYFCRQYVWNITCIVLCQHIETYFDIILNIDHMVHINSSEACPCLCGQNLLQKL